MIIDDSVFGQKPLATISFARNARPAYDAAIPWFSSGNAFECVILFARE